MPKRTDNIVFGAIADQINDTFSEMYGNRWRDDTEFMIEFIPVSWGDGSPYDVSKRLGVILEGIKTDMANGSMINILETEYSEEDYPDDKRYHIFVSYVPDTILKGTLSMPSFLVFAFFDAITNSDTDFRKRGVDLILGELKKEMEVGFKIVPIKGHFQLERAFKNHTPPYEARYPDHLYFFSKDEM
jgi:hypothetical protein